MKVIITAATLLEIKPLVEHLATVADLITGHEYSIKHHTVKVVIGGVGMMATAYNVGKEIIMYQPQLVIQAGIAGSFDRNLQLGDVVQITSETLGDLGVEDNLVVKDMFEIGLLKENEAPFTGNQLINPHQLPYFNFPGVKGVTVNLVSGSIPTIERLEKAYQPSIESMEGAAFHYVCIQEQVPFVQLRSISNYVEIRDKSKWNIPLAVQSLNKALTGFIDQL
ncbi:futalosine hydrolase [Chitinophaga skermanii]|nr:futalosine hydrolase [Chitinophaga skermanii]